MSNSLYEVDFHAWLGEQARALLSGDIAALDLQNLAEEIDGLAGSQRRELKSRLIVLIMHLLKWQMQEEHRSRGWSNTIREQRTQLELLLEQSPSLRPGASGVIDAAYPRAKKDAVEELGLLKDPFPADCPYTAEQVLDADFLPTP